MRDIGSAVLPGASCAEIRERQGRGWGWGEAVSSEPERATRPRSSPAAWAMQGADGRGYGARRPDCAGSPPCKLGTTRQAS